MIKAKRDNSPDVRCQIWISRNHALSSPVQVAPVPQAWNHVC